MKNMKKAFKILTRVAIMILVAFTFGLTWNYYEYSCELSASKIYHTEQLSELPKNEAIEWAQCNIGNQNATKWYIIRMIQLGGAPDVDSIKFWKPTMKY